MITSVKAIHHQEAFDAFVMWCALPETLRQPKTQVALAQILQVTDQTLSEWKKVPEFTKLRDKQTREWLNSKTPDIMYGMFLQALKKGNPDLFKMLIVATGSEEFAPVANAGQANSALPPLGEGETYVSLTTKINDRTRALIEEKKAKKVEAIPQDNGTAPAQPPQATAEAGGANQ